MLQLQPLRFSSLPKSVKVAMVQVTDLFRPFADPDDHWDLACTYALAMSRGRGTAGGYDRLSPANRHRSRRPGRGADELPDRSSVPVIVGSPRRIDPREVDRPENKTVLGGMRRFSTFSASHRGRWSSISSDRRATWPWPASWSPRLFAEKCAGVYLNAGSGTQDKALAARLEYNVVLDPVFLRGRFSSCRAPCIGCLASTLRPARGMNHSSPVPAALITGFSRKKSAASFRAGCRTTSLLCSNRAFPNKRSEKQAEAFRPNWLHYLEGAEGPGTSRATRQQYRNMWCTGGFLHAAGLGVSSEGKIVPLDEVKSPLFTFDPVQVQCNAEGVDHVDARSAITQPVPLPRPR